MKIQSLVSTTVLLLSIATASADSAISNIRNEYKLIRNQLSTLKKEVQPLSGYSAEGGSVQGYRNINNKIRFIKVELYGESGKVFEEYYYKNEKLIFSFHETHEYNVPFTVTKELAKDMGGVYFDPKKTKVIENRYYFNSGMLIKWLSENKKKIDSKNKQFIETQNSVIKFSNEMLSKFK